MSGTVLLAGSLALIGVAVVLLGVRLFGSARPAAATGLARTLATIEEHYSPRKPNGPQGSAKSSASSAMLRRLALRLSPKSMPATMQRRLDMAGNPPNWTAERVLGLKGMGLVGLTVFGLLVQFPHVPLMVVWAVVGGAAGFFVPDALLYNIGVKRQAQIQRVLPDALDMLTVSVEAGLGFEAGLARVARETPGPVAAEFTRLLQEMQIGKSRRDALVSMADRTAVPELRAFVHAVAQANELGIPMAQVLREQSRQMRLKRRQRAEEKAQQLSVKIMFPLVICLFPALMLIVIGPGALKIMSGLFGHG